MLSIIIGALLIIGGVLWGLVCLFGAGMASRQVDTWSEIYLPASPGLLAAALGIALIVWR